MEAQKLQFEKDAEIVAAIEVVEVAESQLTTTSAEVDSLEKLENPSDEDKKNLQHLQLKKIELELEVKQNKMKLKHIKDRVQRGENFEKTETGNGKQIDSKQDLNVRGVSGCITKGKEESYRKYDGLVSLKPEESEQGLVGSVSYNSSIGISCCDTELKKEELRQCQELKEMNLSKIPSQFRDVRLEEPLSKKNESRLNKDNVQISQPLNRIPGEQGESGKKGVHYVVSKCDLRSVKEDETDVTKTIGAVPSKRLANLDEEISNLEPDNLEEILLRIHLDFGEYDELGVSKNKNLYGKNDLGYSATPSWPPKPSRQFLQLYLSTSTGSDNGTKAEQVLQPSLHGIENVGENVERIMKELSTLKLVESELKVEERILTRLLDKTRASLEFIGHSKKEKQDYLKNLKGQFQENVNNEEKRDTADTEVQAEPKLINASGERIVATLKAGPNEKRKSDKVNISSDFEHAVDVPKTSQPTGFVMHDEVGCSSDQYKRQSAKAMTTDSRDIEYPGVSAERNRGVKISRAKSTAESEEELQKTWEKTRKEVHNVSCVLNSKKNFKTACQVTKRFGNARRRGCSEDLKSFQEYLKSVQLEHIVSKPI